MFQYQYYNMFKIDVSLGQGGWFRIGVNRGHHVMALTAELGRGKDQDCTKS